VVKIVLDEAVVSKLDYAEGEAEKEEDDGEDGSDYERD
jgi:hypothetical protein